MKIKNKHKGMSLIEILVVITIFAVLGVLVSRSVILTLQGSKKTESVVRVRENLEFAMGIMERLIRNADSIPQCPNPSTSVLNYTSSDGRATSFTCVGIGGASGSVASGSANLTSDAINVTSCSFNCVPHTASNPSSVTISLSAKDKSQTGVTAASVSISNKIYLRNY